MKKVSSPIGSFKAFEQTSYNNDLLPIIQNEDQAANESIFDNFSYKSKPLALVSAKKTNVELKDQFEPDSPILISMSNDKNFRRAN